MSFWSGIGRGISSYAEALLFVFRHGLWYYFIVPVLISMGLYAIGYYSIDAITSLMAGHIAERISGGEIPSALLSFITSALTFLLRKLLNPLFFLAAGFLLRYTVLLFCSPVMSLLSEKTDSIISGKKSDGSFALYLRNLLRAFLFVMRNLMLQMLITIPFLIILWLPLIGWAALGFLYALGWYFTGASIMDYTCERRRFSITQSIRFARQNMGLTMSTGLVFSLLLLVPYAGIPLAVVLAPVASTLSIVEKMNGK